MAPEVAGSNPVIHPKPKTSQKTSRFVVSANALLTAWSTKTLACRAYPMTVGEMRRELCEWQKVERKILVLVGCRTKFERHPLAVHRRHVDDQLLVRNLRRTTCNAGTRSESPLTSTARSNRSR